MACNFLGGEMFAEAMGLPVRLKIDVIAKFECFWSKSDDFCQLLEDYSEWTYTAADKTRQVGGWYKKFDRLSWITIKGPSSKMLETDFY